MLPKQVMKEELVFPRIKNDKVAPDFYASKLVTREAKKNWIWDVAKNAPDMQLVQELTRLQENNDKLAAKRAFIKKKRKELDAGWHDLDEKEKTFSESFIKFNRFVRENIEKRERATIKAGEQLMLRMQRARDIACLQDKMLLLYEIKASMEKKIRQYKIYENFLEKTLTPGGDFKSVNDVINRYESLVDTKKKLAEKQERDLTALEHARTTMARSMQNYSLVILGMNNRVADLNLRYGNANRNCIEWETIMTQVKCATIEKLAEIIQIRQNCYNLYVKMCERKNMAIELARDDIEGHFIFIRKTLIDLKRIDDKFHGGSSKENTSHKKLLSKVKAKF